MVEHSPQIAASEENVTVAQPETVACVFMDCFFVMKRLPRFDWDTNIKELHSPASGCKNDEW